MEGEDANGYVHTDGAEDGTHLPHYKPVVRQTHA
jgi:hypothetical protein